MIKLLVVVVIKQLIYLGPIIKLFKSSWYFIQGFSMIITLFILLLKIIKLSKISALIAIGANDNKIVASSSGLGPNLFKSKNLIIFI